ncbi:MAG: heterodisulfide reductase-related iron-sulfur binding cluster, partial [Candidatus Heimdallarchaeota archaeon]
NHMNFVLEWFQKNRVSEVVTICAGCYNYFTKYYSELLNEDFNLRVYHILQFMSAPQNLKKLNLNYHGKAITVSYHDACHLRNSSVPIIEEPRIILNSIENIKLRELDNNKLNSICCGSGGGVYSSFKGNSDYNTNLILNENKRVKILLTACPFCYTAFNRVREENNIKTLVMKFEDFIIYIMEGGKILS